MSRPTTPLSSPRAAARWRFVGTITGVGTAEGTRIVVGCWHLSPFGAFADVMVERADGHRVLLAPSEEVARFVAGTYRFDEVCIVPVAVEARSRRRRVRAGPLDVDLLLGRRTVVGHLLRAVPGPLAESRGWALVIDRLAGLLLPGVRTVGTAGGGRREWYGARDEHRVVAARARWAGADLGGLRPVSPPARFGFSSTPAGPSEVAVVTTVQDLAAAEH
ncbi:hypothetical protein MF406_01675 [Georgenia sp. TF02-10]|uniref:hypothetical protein n=1 Tax=Georgenia sp. TF02-10 TaxID=2917725 RepID=UPI001FA6FA7F|nr:hypothetical protein [Georgenia sp. TF02-10]UNX55022.1 hypothetical protein MF406_01675 [Georgenia sp. TF02-10]